jgi:hypothetical protein
MKMLQTAPCPLICYCVDKVSRRSREATVSPRSPLLSDVTRGDIEDNRESEFSLFISVPAGNSNFHYTDPYFYPNVFFLSLLASLGNLMKHRVCDVYLQPAAVGMKLIKSVKNIVA